MITKQDVFTPYHYTSVNCMKLYKKYAGTGCSVLDIGTGTGILAIKAREYGAGRILATDIDPKAVECAKLNCEGLYIEVAQKYLNWDINEKFDIILANLYRNPAVEILPYAHNSMYTDSILILTWPNDLSYFMIEEHFNIIDSIEGPEYTVYALKTK